MEQKSEVDFSPPVDPETKMAARVSAEGQKVFFFLIFVVKECDNVTNTNQSQFIK